MEADQAVELLKAISAFCGAISWPLVVLFILLYFAPPLKRFLHDVGEFSFKAGATGLEATAKRQMEAAALLGAASAKSDRPKANGVEADEARDIAQVVSQAVQPRALRRLSEARALWVDDNPSNNRYERRALEALGINFTTSLDTDSAIDKLQLQRFDVIISDMLRGDEQLAGYDLLERKKKLSDDTPLVFYTSNVTPEQKAQARRKGAFGQATNPQELFALVLGAIG